MGTLTIILSNGFFLESLETAESSFNIEYIKFSFEKFIRNFEFFRQRFKLTVHLCEVPAVFTNILTMQNVS